MEEFILIAAVLPHLAHPPLVLVGCVALWSLQQFPPQKFLSQKQRLRPDLKKVLRKLLPVNQYTVTQT